MLHRANPIRLAIKASTKALDEPRDWARYSGRRTEWTARARRCLKFCEIQGYLIALLDGCVQSIWFAKWVDFTAPFLRVARGLHAGRGLHHQGSPLGRGGLLMVTPLPESFALHRTL